MEHTRSEVVKKVKKIVYKYTCDFCNKEELCNKIPKNWYSIGTGHHDWGNDSSDSFISYEFCSFECFMRKIDEDENKYYKSFFVTIDDLNYEHILDIKKILRIGD